MHTKDQLTAEGLRCLFSAREKALEIGADNVVVHIDSAISDLDEIWMGLSKKRETRIGRRKQQ